MPNHIAIFESCFHKQGKHFPYAVIGAIEMASHPVEKFPDVIVFEVF
jgi:hypothetical protein